jgi:hypothetical protein
MMAEETISEPIPFGFRVDLALLRNKMSRRDLIEALKEYGIIFSDTKLSNRCAGINSFTDEEKQAIEKYFKKAKIEF